MSGRSRNTNELAHLENQLSAARNEINNLRQQLKTLNHVHKKQCQEIHETLNTFTCSNCKAQTSSTINGINQASTSNDSELNSINLKYIGTIHTQFPSKRGTPRQPTICTEAVGKLVLNNDVLTNPHHALEGLDQFSHMWIIFHFHKTESTHVPAKVAPPRLNGLRVGVFGTRSPHRPSPLGLSLVKINQISDNVIYFNGVDMMDQTPVLDIKPYIPHYDSPNQLSLFFPESGMYESSDEEQMRPPSGDGQPRDESQYPEDGTTAANRNVRTLEGQENERSDIVPGAIANETSRFFTFEAIRPNSRMGEREAPDGEEEGTDNASLNTTRPLQSTNPTDAVRLPVRIPRWVDNPVVQSLRVHFKMSAEIQLRQLGAEGEEKKRIIKNVLAEDPRSVYLRERQGEAPYVFRIADLYVTCGFNDEERTVSVSQVIKSDVGDSIENSTS